MIYDSKLGKIVFNLNTLIEFQDLTGQDALEVVGKDRGTTDNIKFIRDLYVCAAKTGGVEVNMQAFGELSFTELADLLNAFVKSVSVPAEGSADTQQGQTARN